MACSTATKRITRAVHSDRSQEAGNELFFCFLRLRLDQWKEDRLSIIVESSTGNLKATVALRYGNDEAALDAATPSATGINQTNDGVTYGTAFGTLNDDYQLADIGVEVINSSGTEFEMGYVTLIIDLRS